jgi:nucleotide-binding universal stress UspA family protein
MFRRILVPLDGSKRAESALTVAKHIARSTGGSIFIVQVITSTSNSAFPDTASQAKEQETVSAEQLSVFEYLMRQQQMGGSQGITIYTNILFGSPVQQLLSFIEAQHIDLVVLCSRGETDSRHWMRRSIARTLLRQSPAPLLILHESAGWLSNQHPSGLQPVRVLVALDGSSLAEKALQPAAALSNALSGSEAGVLHLVRVLRLPQADQMYGRGSAAFQLDVSVAQTYLRMEEIEITEDFRDGMRCQLQASVVGEKDIADGLIRVAEDGLPSTSEEEVKSPSDVIALATHRRHGIERRVLGSIAGRLLDRTRLPLLVVPSSWSDEQNEQEKQILPELAQIK